MHPRAEAKIKAEISHFSIGADSYKGRCFYLHRSDATKTDFSYLSDVYAHLYRDPRWTKCSQIQRQMFPMCEATGCKRLADLADHHVPAAIFIALCREQKRFPIAESAFFYMGNLRSLCSSCHRLKSIEDDKLLANNGPWPDIFANPIRTPRRFF
jgi:hypothetical protein